MDVGAAPVLSVARAGDDDPIDVCEVGGGSGGRARRVGEVYAVKVVGALGMVDEGEMDWKLLALPVDHALAPRVHGARASARLAA